MRHFDFSKLYSSSYILLCLFSALTNIAHPQSPLESLACLTDFKYCNISGNSSISAKFQNESFSPYIINIADISGAGVISKLTFNISTNDYSCLRKMMLMIYWDGEEKPSVESPIGDFYGVGHGKRYTYSSLPLSSFPNNDMISYWKMPFKKSSRILLMIEDRNITAKIRWSLDYYETDLSKPGISETFSDSGYFHAKYNQEDAPIINNIYTILEAEGSGYYAGCNLSVELVSGGWWGEGDDIIKIDSGDTSETLFGTGTEDYFCGAWCYGMPFASDYFGCPLRGSDDVGGLWNVYRYHIADPIPFKKSLSVKLEAFHYKKISTTSDNYSSVVYWYQKEPHKEFQYIPPAIERLPKMQSACLEPEGIIEAEDLKIIDYSEHEAFKIQDVGHFSDSFSNNHLIWFMSNEPDDYITFECEVRSDNSYIIEGYFSFSGECGIFDVYIDGKKLNKNPIDCYYGSPINSGKINLGMVKLKRGKHRIRFQVVGKNEKSNGYYFTIDCLRFAKANPDKYNFIVDNSDISSGFMFQRSMKVVRGVEFYNSSALISTKDIMYCKAIWTPNISKSGMYAVYFRVPTGIMRYDDKKFKTVSITIKHYFGEKVLSFDCSEKSEEWRFIGNFFFKKGKDYFISVEKNSDNEIFADAVKFNYINSAWYNH